MKELTKSAPDAGRLLFVGTTHLRYANVQELN